MNRRGTEPYAQWCGRTAGAIPPPTRFVVCVDDPSLTGHHGGDVFFHGADGFDIEILNDYFGHGR